ncbi:MAG: phytanoyl-CoA dioxygenase family protein [Ilumatobacter sp.]|nr:phytanoyl-CoA dioxygenase family protein [Ilumatobacter sp.]
MDELNPPAWRDRPVDPDTAPTVRSRGFGVVEAVLPPSSVAAAIDALGAVFAAEDDIALARRWRTNAYRVAYMLPAKHRHFLALCRPSPLAELAAALLGRDCVLAGFNGLDMIPGGEAQPLHRDHAVPTPGVPLYLHAVVALDAFTVASGATRIVPGSHREATDEPVTQNGPPPEVDTEPNAAVHDDRESEAVHVGLQPGDALVYDATCVHAGSANTTDHPRRALHVLFARRWVQPLWDFPGSLSADDVAGLDPERRRLLGFGNTPARYDHDARRSFGYGWG